MNIRDIEQIISEEQARDLSVLAANRNTAPIYEVAVGAIGFVYEGHDRAKAEQAFWRYRNASQQRQGRAAGEQVVLFEDGEPIKEWAGDYDE